MKLKVVELKEMKHREMLLLGLFFCTSMGNFLITTMNLNEYFFLPLLFLLLGTIALILPYGKGRMLGDLEFTKEAIVVNIPGEEQKILPEDLSAINLKYTNSYKTRGKFIYRQANIIVFKKSDGYEKRFQIVIEGKEQKKKFKEVLEKYRSNGTTVNIASVVSSTWREF